MALWGVVPFYLMTQCDSDEYLEIQNEIFKSWIIQIKNRTNGINKSMIFNNDEEFREMLEKLSR
jgi:hypothetical protein